jgi:DNA replication protein DnaC
VDELGYLPFEADASLLFFQLVSRLLARFDPCNEQPPGGRAG